MPTTYYVASAGSNSNNGTSTGTPFATIAKAQSVAVAGDTVNLNGGDTFSENVTFTVGVTIQSYGTGQAIWAGGTTTPLVIQDCDGWTISNLKFTMSSTSNATNVYKGVVHLSNTSGTRYTVATSITGCDISGGPSGVTAICNSTDSGGWNNLSITHNTIHDCAELGIFPHESGNVGAHTHFSNIYIAYNEIYNIVGDGNSNGASGIGISIANSDSGTVEYNYVHDLGSSFSGTAGGPGG